MECIECQQILSTYIFEYVYKRITNVNVLVGISSTSSFYMQTVNLVALYFFYIHYIHRSYSNAMKDGSSTKRYTTSIGACSVSLYSTHKVQLYCHKGRSKLNNIRIVGAKIIALSF